MRNGTPNRSLRPFVLAAAALVLFVAGMAARTAVDDGNGDLAKRGGWLEIPAAPARENSDGPTTVVAGVPAGYARTEAGARAATLTFAAVVPQQMMYASHD